MIQLHPYSLFLAVSALATFIVLIITRRRTAPGSFALSGLLFAMFLWGLMYAFTWAVIPLHLKIFWLKAMYFGVVMVPALFLVFTLQITHRDRWLTLRNFIILSIEPLVILLLIWLYPSQLFAAIHPAFKDGFTTMQIQRGAWVLINSIYSYSVILLSFFLLIQSSRSANSFFKRQYRIVLYGSIIPLALSIFSQTQYTALDQLDLTPITFGISGIVCTYAIFRHQFMNLIPIARGRLIESMSDGVLVVDAQGRIVDINPSMKNFLDDEPTSFLGKNISEALNIWNGNAERLLAGQEIRTELKLPNKPSLYVDLRVTLLYDNDQHLNGRLIIFRDITDRKEVEKDLRHAMDRLQTQLIEIGLLQSQLREQAIRDVLTNLFNRRYLEETLERELARASRENYPLCLVMMDLDHFKSINDTYGHEAGDVVLKMLGKIVTDQSRQGDFVCRFGGDEFMLVMPNISVDIAKERAISLLKMVSSTQFPFGRFNLTTTLSMGISWYPAHGEIKEDLLRTADRALYTAKNAGRNQVAVYREMKKKKG